MSHNIFGDRFLGYREPAWHGIGEVFTDPISPTEAVAQSQLDYQIHRLPVFVSAGGMDLDLGKFALVREPTHDSPEWKSIGVNLVTENYQYYQNTQIAEVLDPIAERYPLETIGALGDGETLFAAFRANHFEIGGDEVVNYFLFTDTRDGGTSAKMALTPVRTVCQNTLVSGLRAATLKLDITHDTSHRVTTERYLKIFGQMDGSMDRMREAFQSMVNGQINAEQVQSIMRAAYPAPSRPKKLDLLDTDIDDASILYEELSQVEATFQYHMQRAAVYSDAATELFAKISDEYPNIAGTPWAAYNAVVECEDFRNGGGKVQESAVWGARASAKKRAFNVAYAMAQ